MDKTDFALHHVAYSPDGKKYVTSAQVLGSYFATMASSGMRHGKRLFVVDPPVHGVSGRSSARTVSHSPRVGDRDPNCIVLWDANTGKQVHRFPQMGVCLDRPAFSRDGKLVAAATTDTKCVKVWDVASGEEVASWTDTKPMCAVALSPDGRLLAAGHHDGAISLWDVAEKGRKKRTWEGHSGHDNPPAIHARRQDAGFFQFGRHDPPVEPRAAAGTGNHLRSGRRIDPLPSTSILRENISSRRVIVQ